MWRRASFGAVLSLLASDAAHAEQPRGTYILDRDSTVQMYDGNHRPHPSCGGEKLFGGQATFVVEYGDTIWVNERAWDFYGHTFSPGWKPPGHRDLVVITDPKNKHRIYMWFGKEPGRALGYLHVVGAIDGKACVDAWTLKGKYSARLKPRN